jgi:hypothetical protein
MGILTWNDVLRPWVGWRASERDFLLCNSSSLQYQVYRTSLFLSSKCVAQLRLKWLHDGQVNRYATTTEDTLAASHHRTGLCIA